MYKLTYIIELPHPKQKNKNNEQTKAKKHATPMHIILKYYGLARS